MSAKELKNKIDFIILNNELSKDTIKILLEIKEEIKDDSTVEQRLTIFIKWMSIFKDATNIFSIFKDYF